MMDVDLYDYTPIVARDRIQWPDGARVAFYVAVHRALLGPPSRRSREPGDRPVGTLSTRYRSEPFAH
jgi:hypothetical protein